MNNIYVITGTPGTPGTPGQVGIDFCAMNKQERLIELNHENYELINSTDIRIRSNPTTKQYIRMNNKLIKILNNFDDKYDLIGNYNEFDLTHSFEKMINTLKYITKELDNRSLCFADEVLNDISPAYRYKFFRNKKIIKKCTYGYSYKDNSDTFTSNFLIFLYNLQEQLKREDELRAKLAVKEETITKRKKI